MASPHQILYYFFLSELSFIKQRFKASYTKVNSKHYVEPNAQYKKAQNPDLPITTYKLNFNSSVHLDGGCSLTKKKRAAVGFVVGDSNGRVKLAGAVPISFCMVLEAEAIGRLKFGLMSAK